MRMRSVLAAALLTVTLTAAGAATAAAADFDPRHGGGDDGADVCATHYGAITSEEGNLAWGGSFCRGDL
ncbi:hypothetical protein AB0E88_25215 [Streptomyces sp. NPDC028635]|uniref:hypothetical protein n=1 Tax=Streptomyces sp. NPDC028635 TaxID=3154800 RepID=UPI0033E990CB